MEVDHVGKGNPHAQESCGQEKRKQGQPEGSDRALPGTRPVLKSLCLCPLYRRENGVLERERDLAEITQLLNSRAKMCT